MTMRDIYLSAETPLIRPSSRSLVLELAISVVRLGHDDDTLPRDLVLPEKLAEDDLRFTRGIGVGSVKGLRAITISGHITRSVS